MKRLAAASALIAFALFGGVTFASGSTGHVQANLPVWPKLSTKQVGRYETRLSFAVTTKPGARCGGSIAAGGQKVSLPVVIATQGLATWSWAVTAGGPSGRWSMNAQCNVSGASGKATIQPIVILPVGNRSPLIAPDSLAVAAGRSVKPLHHITTTHKTGIGAASGDPFINEKGYCTYGAWEHAQWLGSNVWGNAIDWYAEASGKLPEGTTPKAGAVFVWKIGKWGHVGLVTGPANAQGSFPTMEMNGGAMVDSVNAITTEFGKWVAHTRNVGSDMFFIYPPAPAAPVFNASAYIGHIVKQNNGNVTAWLVVNDNGPKRNWIPDQSTYECLKAKGAPGPDLLSAAQLDQMPDENGVWVHCASSPPPTTTTVSQPPPPPPTTTTAPAAPKPDTTPPSVPLGLQATSSSQTSITVAWNASTDNVGVAGYFVFLNGSHVSNASATSATLSGLSCGQSYRSVSTPTTPSRTTQGRRPSAPRLLPVRHRRLQPRRSLSARARHVRAAEPTATTWRSPCTTSQAAPIRSAATAARRRRDSSTPTR